jgi:hypothetical protein
MWEAMTFIPQTSVIALALALGSPHIRQKTADVGHPPSCGKLRLRDAKRNSVTKSLGLPGTHPKLLIPRHGGTRARVGLLFSML